MILRVIGNVSNSRYFITYRMVKCMMFRLKAIIILLNTIINIVLSCNVNTGLITLILLVKFAIMMMLTSKINNC